MNSQKKTVDITVPIHGGGVAKAARELGIDVEDILDFSASINPLGMPEGVKRAAIGALDESVHYPEVDASSLRQALAEHHNLPAANILPGSGSTELLYLFPRILKPKRVLLVIPAFCEYERSFAQSGTKVDYFILDPEADFELDPAELLHAVKPDTDLVLLANPGNPTGQGIDPGAIELIARSIREQALLAVDEAFADFCPSLSAIEQVTEHTNLYVFRSMTKFYGIAGLRAGYIAGPAMGIAHLAACKEPWTISTPALAAAKACLIEEEYQRQTLESIPLLRERLAAGLKELGMRVFPGKANYLLARLQSGQSVTELASSLRGKGILIRNCSSFSPLDDSYLRVAVRSATENSRLLEAIAEVVAGPK